MHGLHSIKEAYEPTVVGVPPSNAFRNLIRLPDGTIRCYGFCGPSSAPRPVYLESADHGLTWQERHPDSAVARCQSHPTDEHAAPIAPVVSPLSGDCYYLRSPSGPDAKLMMWRSKTGVDGPYEPSVVEDKASTMVRQPLYLRHPRHRGRVVVASTTRTSVGDERRGSLRVLLSDDDGLTWRSRTGEGSLGVYPVAWPHKGRRWQNYVAEPTVAELSDGRLWALLRTSTDNQYESFSDDGGETWSALQPSRFYATITMPTFHTLPDGRLLLFWCNTTPLPEREHGDAAIGRHNAADLRSGRWEDVFTNRDATHVAISEDDGATWIGFRELFLNPLRNAPDFAEGQGGPEVSLDKSVHQAQAVDLPEGKVLVALGQHPGCRRLVVFDPAWVYETQRQDDFRQGLDAWSVHQYIDGIHGHCAYDRQAGAKLVTHPDEPGRLALQVRRLHEPHLVSDVQGAVWNFPASGRGAFTTRIRLLPGCRGGRINLVDRWFNPTDTVAHHFSMYTVAFAGSHDSGAIELPLGQWHDLRFEWDDLEQGACRMAINGAPAHQLPLVKPSRNGICYVMLQSVFDGYDDAGFLVDHMHAVRQ